MNDLEVLQVKVQTSQLAARALGVDPELYVSTELPDQIRSVNPGMGELLDRFVGAFDAWSGFHRRIEAAGRQGQLTGDETTELMRLRREKDDARERLFAKVNEAKSAPSWVHGVVDPLMSSLQHPMFFLNKGGWTWRFHTKALEWVRPIREMFDPGEHARLDAFLSRFPAIAELVKAWDRTRDDLEPAATAEWERVLALPPFKRAYEECLAAYLAEKEANPHQHLPLPWGAWPKDRGPELVAEHVVNNRTEIESHNTSAAFWHEHSAAIIRSVQADESWQRLNARAEELGARLRECGGRLYQELQAARERLSTEYAHVTRPPHFTPD